MKYDQTVRFNDALIQYGPLNDRIYLMKLGDADPMNLIPELDDLAKREGLGKIFAKVPKSEEALFRVSGYRCEARVPNFYRGKREAVFLGKYFDPDRRDSDNVEELKEIFNLATGRAARSDLSIDLPDGFTFCHCREEDAEKVSHVYNSVFTTYPFPVHDPAYIRKTMDDNILYFSIRHRDKIVALSSVEIDRENLNVEMTDFATLPRWRGRAFAPYLLSKMEIDMRKMGIKTAYTIARAISPGINITFARRAYTYGGRLINNTNIGGGLESMNIWHKSL